MNLHAKILALETDGRAGAVEPFTLEAYKYNCGFQDARHAAAELAAPVDALVKELLEALKLAERWIREAAEEDGANWNWVAINADDGEKLRAALVRAALLQGGQEGGNG